MSADVSCQPGSQAAPGWACGDLGFWGCSTCRLGFWLGLGALDPGWCITGGVGGCMHRASALAGGPLVYQ